MARYRAIKVPIEHPLARMNSTYTASSGLVNVWEHRIVLWNKIGAGPHRCHWCQKPLQWRPGERTCRGALTVDHLDGDVRNNDPTNLVPSCQGCNAHRVHPFALVRDDEPHVVRAGRRLRGVVCVCARCGNEFVRTHAEMRRPKGTPGRYCSMACMHALPAHDPPPHN